MTHLSPVPTPPDPGSPYQDAMPLLGSGADIDPSDLIYFLLSVGNADTQLIVLPEDHGIRHLAIVDVGKVAGSKLPGLIDLLLDMGYLTAESRIKLLVATHPHADHVGGIPDLLAKKGDMLIGGQVWDPGFYHTTGSWHSMMYWLETNPGVGRTHPTAGTRVHLGTVAFTALSPSIRLRNNYDTYGVKINNSSIALMVEFPVKRAFTGTAATFGSGQQDRQVRRTRLLLGADAQNNSWSHVDVDFNQLARDNDPKLRLLGHARGREPLDAHIFKVPHHASKNGLNLELVTRIDPAFSFISCKDSNTGHAFPHEVALDQLREAKEKIATDPSKARSPDWDPVLRILTTADRLTDGRPLGTIATVLSVTGRKRHVFRLGDEPDKSISIARLRQTWQLT